MHFFANKWVTRIVSAWKKTDTGLVYGEIMMISLKIHFSLILSTLTLFFLLDIAFGIKLVGRELLFQACFNVGMVGLPASVLFGLLGGILHSIAMKEREPSEELTVESLHKTAFRLLGKNQPEDSISDVEPGDEIEGWFRIARLDGDTGYVLGEGDLELYIIKSPHLVEYAVSCELEVAEWSKLHLREIREVGSKKVQYYRLLSITGNESSFVFPALLLGDEYASTFILPEDEEQYELAKELVSYRDDFFFVVPATSFSGYASSPSSALKAFVIADEDGVGNLVLVYAHSEREAYLIAYFDENIPYATKSKIKDNPTILRREDLDFLPKKTVRRSWGFVEHDKSALYKAGIVGEGEHLCSTCHTGFPIEMADFQSHFSCRSCGGIQCLLYLADNFRLYAISGITGGGDICCTERAKRSLLSIGQERIKALHSKLVELFRDTLLTESIFYPDLGGLELKKEGLSYKGTVFVHYLNTFFPITLHVEGSNVRIFDGGRWVYFTGERALESLAKFQAKKLNYLASESS